jgi:dTMP kinase
MPGLLIVFEGLDGAGKTTQAKMLAEYLEKLGLDVELTAEPSKGYYGKMIRALSNRPSPEKEMELFAMDRADHIDSVVRPALDRGAIVISDRSLYSSLAYQAARGLDRSEILNVNQGHIIEPDMVFLMETTPESALKRIRKSRGHAETPFEEIENLKRVKQEYDNMDYPFFRRINAMGDVAHIHEEIVKIVETKLVHEGLVSPCEKEQPTR